MTDEQYKMLTGHGDVRVYGPEEGARNARLAKAEPVTDRIRSAYQSSIGIYDDMMTQGNIFSRLYIRFFWSGTDDNEIAKNLLSYIPEDFAGSLLDVPVGTAVFTEKKWKALKKPKSSAWITVRTC